jgi:DNA polymerase III subunit beta
MRFQADRAEFAKAAAAVAQGLPLRPAIPVHLGMLVHVFDGFVQLTASDGDTAFNMTVPGTTTEEGGFIFPRVFPDAVKSLAGDELAVSVQGSQALLTCGRSEFTFSVEPGRKFPFPVLDVPELGFADGEQFRAALKQVLPAASKDNPLPALTALMLQARPDSLTVVATDKYALACSRVDWDGLEHDPALLPARLAEFIARMDGERVRIGWDGNRFQVRSGSFTITCRLIQGQFPMAWDKILQAAGKWQKLPDELTSVVKRAALALHPSDGGGIYLDFGDELTVTSSGKARFSESVPMECEPLRVKVGCEMLLDALACCDEVLVGNPLVLQGERCRWMVQVRREVAEA